MGAGVAFLLLGLLSCAVGLELPAFKADSALTQGSFTDLNQVVNHHIGTSLFRQQSTEQWRTLLSFAARVDLYTAANMALFRVRALVGSDGEISNLECLGSEVLEQENPLSARISYYLVGKSDEEPLSLIKSSTCQPVPSLSLPDRYEAPIPKSSRRMLRELDADVEEHAKRVISQAHQASQVKVIEMEEELTIVDMTQSSFIMGAVELLDGGFLIAIYSRSSASPDRVIERNVEVTLADEAGNSYRITVSSHPSSLKREVNYSVTKSVRINAPSAKSKRGLEPDAKRIMTYNIWNYNADWNQRKQMIAQFIAEQQPDLVGVQEIRYRYSGGPNQLTEIAEQLQARNQTYHYIYQPAMYYDTEAEGVGILSRYPIIDHDYINLTFVPNTPDGNRRIVLRTLVFDEENHKLFNFFVSHFTYARGEGQMSNAFELFNFMKRQRSDIPQSVVADFNIYVGSEEPTNFLTGKLTYRGVRGDLSDVWELAHGHDNNLGYTFSNLPWSSGLINRADRMLIRNMPRAYGDANTTITTGRVTPGGAPASDHLAVCSLVAYLPPTLAQ